MTIPNAAHAETPRPKKRSLGTSDKTPSPKPEAGHSIWIEHGEWFTAPTVDPKKFGPHAYEGAYVARSGMGNCPCGCEMRSSSSSGPVDPFGMCPLNPLPAEAETPRPTPRTDAPIDVAIEYSSKIRQRIEAPHISGLTVADLIIEAASKINAAAETELQAERRRGAELANLLQEAVTHVSVLVAHAEHVLAQPYKQRELNFIARAQAALTAHAEGKHP